jgi:hypothetical protein
MSMTPPTREPCTSRYPPALARPDGVNASTRTIDSNRRSRGNPHLDEDSYVSKRWRRPVSPVTIGQCAVHLIGRVVV